MFGDEVVKESFENSPGQKDTPLSKKKAKNVLVVGDWVVDENWTVAAHQSPTATEPVGSHFRSIVARDAAVFSFCGAGRVARALYWMNRYKAEGQAYVPAKDPHLNIFGLGIWAVGDGQNLRSFFRPGSTEGSNPYQLLGKHLVKAEERLTASGDALELDGVELINLASVVDAKSREPLCTTRIYRVFRTLQDEKLEMVQRIDWELPAAEFKKHGHREYREWTINQDSGVEELLSKGLHGTEIDAIVVKCLGKGVVSDKLVAILKRRFPEAEWYVSSKLGVPQWLDCIKGPGPTDRLKLLFLPPIPMANVEQVPEWFMSNGLISREAEAYIQTKIIGENLSSAVVIMPRGLSIIALNIDEKKRWQVCTHFNSEFDRLTERIGKASIFFASLVANSLIGAPFDLSIMRSLDKALLWRQNEERRLSKGNPEAKETAYDPDLSSGGLEELKPRWRIRGSEWEEDKRCWYESRHGLGIITSGDSSRNKRYRFELWRGMSVIEDYVALVETRRDAVRQLYNLARSFINPRYTQNESRTSVSCMLVDSPGRGKTVLVRSLAKKLGISFLPFNITEMVNREDIINSFDVIVTTQARERGRPVLVFIDEIDALLNGPVFDLFLAPLEDGVYVRGGNRFRIDPCIWIFAGTKSLKGVEGKASDFVSRLTNGEITLADSIQEAGSQNPTMDHLRRLERVYVGVNMLRTRYRDLRYVTAGVLLYFYRVNPGVSMRKIRHFVEKIRDVEYAKVSQRNLPATGTIIETEDIDLSIDIRDFEVVNMVDEEQPIEVSELTTDVDSNAAKELDSPPKYKTVASD